MAVTPEQQALTRLEAARDGEYLTTNPALIQYIRRDDLALALSIIADTQPALAQIRVEAEVMVASAARLDRAAKALHDRIVSQQPGHAPGRGGRG